MGKPVSAKKARLIVAQILTDARELLSDPSKWTKHVYARDASGTVVLDMSSRDAVCWCAMGAVLRSTPGGVSFARGEPVDMVQTAMSAATGRATISCFNDDPKTTHADILAAFDRAIATQPQRKKRPHDGREEDRRPLSTARQPVHRIRVAYRPGRGRERDGDLGGVIHGDVGMEPTEESLDGCTRAIRGAACATLAVALLDVVKKLQEQATENGVSTLPRQPGQPAVHLVSPNASPEDAC